MIPMKLKRRSRRCHRSEVAGCPRSVLGPSSSMRHRDLRTSGMRPLTKRPGRDRRSTRAQTAVVKGMVVKPKMVLVVMGRTRGRYHQSVAGACLRLVRGLSIGMRRRALHTSSTRRRESRPGKRHQAWQCSGHEDSGGGFASSPRCFFHLDLDI